MEIRAAMELDILQILTLAKEYAEEADSWMDLEFDPVRLSTHIAMAMTDPDQMIFVAHEKGVIVGSMWGVVSAPVWTSDKLAYDMFLYISQRSRDLFTAVKLVRAYEEWATTNGAKIIQTGANSGILENKGAKALYRHCGYICGGQNFYKRRI
jgi:GNAT superfamily N-acetyltransferase